MLPADSSRTRSATEQPGLRKRSGPVHANIWRPGWHWLLAVPLVLWLAVSILPFVWMISTSLKSPNEANLRMDALLPQDWVSGIQVFGTVWNELHFFQESINSLVIAVGIVVMTWLVYGLAGYAFAVLRFPGRDQIFLLFLLLIFVPGVTILIPLLVLLENLHLTGTPWAVILPIVNGGGSVAIFLLRSYFRSLSPEIRESAKIDGASELRVWGQIYMPLALPALTYLGITGFMAGFKELVLPLLTLTSDSTYPLTLGVYYLNQTEFVQWNLVMAGSLVLILPILIVYLLFQRYYIQGLTLGAVRG
jgi:multiple sugar transport system permease protein